MSRSRKEIRWHAVVLRPVPKAYLPMHSRQAFIGRRDPELRITFDQNYGGGGIPATDAAALPGAPAGPGQDLSDGD